MDVEVAAPVLGANKGQGNLAAPLAVKISMRGFRYLTFIGKELGWSNANLIPLKVKTSKHGILTVFEKHVNLKCVTSKTIR